MSRREQPTNQPNHPRSLISRVHNTTRSNEVKCESNLHGFRCGTPNQNESPTRWTIVVSLLWQRRHCWVPHDARVTAGCETSCVCWSVMYRTIEMPAGLPVPGVCASRTDCGGSGRNVYIYTTGFFGLCVSPGKSSGQALGLTHKSPSR